MDARQSLVAAIRRELAQRNVSVRAASRLSGVPIRSLHGLLQGDNVPSINRTKELCDGLGLEFYVGPPRAEETREGVEDRERRLIHDLRAVCEKVLERLDTLSRDRSADLHSGRLVANQVSDEGGSDSSVHGEVVRFPAWRQVEQIDLAVAAGSGAEVDDESVTEHLTFRLDWLRRHGLDPAQCTVVKVQGESMEPALPEGSAILVDRARRRRRVGGIFVVRTADGVVVKKAGKDESGRWLLVSDHPSWEPVPWPQDAKVIGEVKWMARTL